MSKIQRYEPWPQEWPQEDPNGDLVTYEDHKKVVDALEAEVEKLQRDLDDTTVVAENFTDLVRCKGGRIRNAGNSGYVCFICGVDTSIGEKCRAARITEDRK